MAPSPNNVLLGYPNYADVGAVYTPVLSGGSWLSGLPLANLQDRDLSKIARSTNAALTSTKFDMDMGVARALRLYALPRHTISRDGTVRVRHLVSLPVSDWLTVGDGAWTAIGTPTRTPAATFVNGIPLDLVGDDDGAVMEGYYRQTGAFTTSAVKALSFVFKKSSSTANQTILLQKLDGSATLMRCTLNNTGSVPVVAVTTGTLVSTVALPDGGYRVTVLTASLLYTDTHRIVVCPGTETAANTGALYIGDFMLFDAATDQLAYDAGYVAVWPVIYPSGSLPPGHPAEISTGGDGRMTAEDAVGFNIGFTHIAPAYHVGRYTRWEIADTTNPAGYVDLGRVYVALGYQPSCNPDYGLRYGVADTTESQESDGGRTIFNLRYRRRSMSFVMAMLPTDEALVNVFDLQRRAGIAEQVMVVFDPTDVAHMHRRAFLATLQDLSPVTHAAYAWAGVPVTLAEVL